MLLTGRQMRDARETLGWTIAALARATRLPFENVARAERLDGGGMVPIDDIRAIRRALEAAGIDFEAEGPEPPSAQLAPKTRGAHPTED